MTRNNPLNQYVQTLTAILSLLILSVAGARCIAAVAPVIYTWSSFGQGVVTSPTGVALDSSGNVYVADNNTSTTGVDEFTNQGDFISQFGSYGTGSGQMDNPEGIGIESGNIYIADEINYRIDVFNSSHTFVTSFGSKGTNDGQFEGPVTVSFDHLGNIMVSDFFNSRFEIFNPSYAFLSSFGSTGTSDGQFDLPTAIIELPNYDLLASDTFNDRVQEFADHVFTPYATAGIELPASASPGGLALDSDQQLYILDAYARDVLILAKDKSIIQTLGSTGTGINQIGAGALLLAVGSDKSIYVPDYTNGRIDVYRPIALKLNADPSTITEGTTTRGTVQLNGDALKNRNITLTSSDPSVATVPASEIVLADNASVGFEIKAAATVSASTKVTITATAGPAKATTTITVNP